jgi:hypothetical protein
MAMAINADSCPRAVPLDTTDIDLFVAPWLVGGC